MCTQPAYGFRFALEDLNPKAVVLYEDDFNFATRACLFCIEDSRQGSMVAVRLVDQSLFSMSASLPS